MQTYYEIFKTHTGLFSNKWEHYFFIYDILLRELRERGKPATILEIGVANGGSLEIWKKYLPEGSVIHGVDINPECSKIKFSDNIYFHLGSAADNDFMNKTFNKIEFDFILDDGSHISADVIKTFKNMFSKVKNGGLYIIEDLHTSYWIDQGGGLRYKKSSIEYLKSLVDCINSDYHGTIRSNTKLKLFGKLWRRFPSGVKKAVKNLTGADDGGMIRSAWGGVSA